MDQREDLYNNGMLGRLARHLEPPRNEDAAERQGNDAYLSGIAQDAARYRYISTLMDWSDVQRMCWSTTADNAYDFKRGLDKYIDGAMKKEPK